VYIGLDQSKPRTSRDNWLRKHVAVSYWRPLYEYLQLFVLDPWRFKIWPQVKGSDNERHSSATHRLSKGKPGQDAGRRRQNHQQLLSVWGSAWACPITQARVQEHSAQEQGVPVHSANPILPVDWLLCVLATPADFWSNSCWSSDSRWFC